MPLILDLQAEYERAKTDLTFWAEMDDLNGNIMSVAPARFISPPPDRGTGRRENLSQARRAEPYRQPQDQQRAGPDPLARRMGKTRIIAETGAGQHGVATATVCARFGLKCVVYMGAHDVERQAPNVFRMKLLGAEVVPVTSGRGTLKDAMNDACATG